MSTFGSPATPKRPSTPVKQTLPASPQTGTWRHPKLDEIVKRQNASVFNKEGLKKIGYNVAGLAVVHLLGRSLWGRQFSLSLECLNLH
jgi:nucleoporin POM34